jgi:tetratricopeptide (TPR) repeat protein
MMTRNQYLLLAACLVAGVVLFALPKTPSADASAANAVVSTEAELQFAEQLESVKSRTDASALSAITLFEGKLSQSDGQEKIIWLDSLTSIWDRQMRPGIAAEYVHQKARIVNTSIAWQIAGERYLSLGRYFDNADKQFLTSKAIECLEKANEMDKNNPQIATQLGIAYVENGAEPMKGILLLREQADADPKNADAHMNLGFFSMQTGQYDKAISRFEHVLSVDPKDEIVKYYLGEAYLAAGKNAQAKEILTELAKSTDEAIKAQAKDRLNSIK